MFKAARYSPYYYVYASAIKTVSTEYTEEIGDWEYIQSSDRSAYPDSGEQDGYEYQYLGVPFENLPGAPKIETGSYIGTGSYGVSNKNKITCSFKPEIVIVKSDLAGTNLMIAIRPSKTANTITSSTNSNNNATVSWEENSILWYTSGSGAYQLNQSGIRYNYSIFG